VSINYFYLKLEKVAHKFGGDGINVCVEDGTIWLNQKSLAELFQTTTDNIGLHLKNIYLEEELDEFATTEDFSIVR